MITRTAYQDPCQRVCIVLNSCWLVEKSVLKFPKEISAILYDAAVENKAKFSQVKAEEELNSNFTKSSII